MTKSTATPVGEIEETPAHKELFPGFERRRVNTGEIDVVYVIGGEGPPLLLLHGNPLTHSMWHLVAPEFAKHYTVVAPDLRGYGDSGKPAGGGDHSAYSFRTMANDQVNLMAMLGFDEFMVCGHDRGGRAAFRMALDHPEKVKALAILDIVPTYNVLNNVSKGWGHESYHWFFLAQKEPYPEKLICADLDYYMQYKLNKKGVGLEIFHPTAFAEYLRCATPEQIHGVCEDYRATIGIDYEMDSEDYGKKLIECPVHILWGGLSHMNRHFKALKDWREWANQVSGKAVPTGHYPAEQRPDLVLEELLPFFAKVSK